MKRAYMFNLDDFVRIGGQYEIIRKSATNKGFVTGLYKLSLDEEESLADVDVYYTGARMVKFRDDANYELFALAGERRNQALAENAYPFLLRNFLLACRLVLLVLLFGVLPVWSVSVLITGYGIRAALFLTISLLAGALLYRMKPRIWGVMNMENNDLAVVERSVPDEKTQ